MKNTISFLLVIVLLCCMMPSAFAAGNQAVEAADALNSLGLFQGTGTDAAGHPIYALDLTPTRAEAVTMLVRLLGKESEAKSGNWTTPFTDVADWAKPYVGYAYTHKLTMGTGNSTFGDTDPVSATQYLTFILRALGYESGSDFEWDKAFELTDRLGITSGEYHAGVTEFLRGDVASISLCALPAMQKGTYSTLAQKLMDEGAFTKEQYEDVMALTGISKADPRQNQAMVNQQGNFNAGGNCVETPDMVYYITNVRDMDSTGRYTYRMAIIGRTDGGKTEEIYDTADSLKLLSTDLSGAIYFVENGSDLRRYDQKTGKTTLVFSDGNREIESYTFYDGKVYFLDCLGTDSNIDTWPYRIMCFDGTQARTLVSGNYLTLNDATVLYAYNGKLYYPFGEHVYIDPAVNLPFADNSLYAIDLSTGKSESVIKWDQARITDDIAFYEDTMWSLSDQWKTIQKTSLTDPSETEIVATIPEAGGLYPMLYANGKTVYYQVSGACRVWRILPDGTVTVAAKTPTPYYEASFVNRQGTAVMSLKEVRRLIPSQIHVETRDGQSMTYPEFLGMPYAASGWNLHSAVEAISFSAVEEENACKFELLRAYRDAEGNLIAELRVDNQEPGTVEFRNAALDLIGLGKQVHCFVEGEFTVGAGEAKEISLVLPREYSEGIELDGLCVSAYWSFTLDKQNYYFPAEYSAD